MPSAGKFQASMGGMPIPPPEQFLQFVFLYRLGRLGVQGQGTGSGLWKWKRLMSTIGWQHALGLGFF